MVCRFSILCDSCGWDGSEETRHVLADQIKLDKFESQVEKPLRVIKNSEGWTNAKTEKKVMTNEDVALSPIIVDFQTGERVYTIGFAVIRRMLPLQERLKLLKTHQVRYMAA